MVVSESDVDRDNWVRLTLRLPPDLHAQIVRDAGALSLNAAIVQKLTDDHALRGELDLLRARLLDNEKRLMGLLQRQDETRSEIATNEKNEDLLTKIGALVRACVREEIEKALRAKK